MQIALLEAYYGGSHKAWADGYRDFSAHEVRLITMPAQFWKWRMQGGAVTMARLLDWQPELILASGMLDLSLFRALTWRRFAGQRRRGVGKGWKRPRRVWPGGSGAPAGRS